MSRRADHYDERLLRHAALALIVAGLIALLFASKVHVDNRLESWVRRDKSETERYHHFRQTFGSDEYVIVAVTGQPLFVDSTMDPLLDALEALERIPQVARVSGLPTVYRDLFGAEDVGELEEEMQSTPFYRNLFISADGEIAGLLIETEPDPTAGGRRDLVVAIAAALEPLDEIGLDVHLAGPPVLDVALDSTSAREAGRTFPLAFLASLVALLLLLRSIRAVLVAVCCASLTIALDFGLMGLLDRPLNMVTAVLPALLWVLGLANLIHLLRRYLDLRGSGRSTEDAVESAWNQTSYPCLLSALTTAAGFISLTAATITPVRELGLFAATGMVFSVLVNLTVGPTLIRWLRIPATGSRTTEQGWESRLPIGGTKLLAFSILLALGAMFTLRSLRVEANPLQFFSRDARIVQDYELISTRLTGMSTLEVLITTPHGWLDSDAWPVLERVAGELAALDAVARVVSPLDFLKKLSHWDQNFDPEAYKLPRDEQRARDLVAELDESSMEELDRLVGPNGKEIRLSVLVNEMDSSPFQNVTRVAEEALRSLPLGFDGGVTGIVLQVVTAQLTLVQTQLRSFGLAFAAVFIVIFLGLRSWRLTLASVVPNLLPILSAFATMSLFAIPLDAATVMVASVALGIGVDNTVHFLAHYRRLIGEDELNGSGERTEDGSTRLRQSALRSTLTTVGAAMSVTTVAAGIGFFSLCRSEFVPLSYFGSLSGIAILVALVADLVVLPALLATFPWFSGGSRF